MADLDDCLAKLTLLTFLDLSHNRQVLLQTRGSPEAAAVQSS